MLVRDATWPRGHTAHVRYPSWERPSTTRATRRQLIALVDLPVAASRVRRSLSVSLNSQNLQTTTPPRPPTNNRPTTTTESTPTPSVVPLVCCEWGSSNVCGNRFNSSQFTLSVANGGRSVRHLRSAFGKWGTSVWHIPTFPDILKIPLCV